MRNKEFLLILAIISLNAYAAHAVLVSVILEDNALVRAEDNMVTHTLKAHMDVENVTVIDYFSGVDAKGAVIGEFLGEPWDCVKTEIGDMKKGETREISYKILGGAGDVLLGADVYYIQGERHQLFPSKTGVNIKNDITVGSTTGGSSTGKTGEAGNEQWILAVGIFVTLIFAVLILYLRTKGKS